MSLLFDPPPAIAIGLIILAICPSGVTSNAYTFAARGDVPLAVTLSALTSVITVFTIPFVIGLALSYFAYGGEPVTISAATMLQRLATITLLPLAIGMLIRHFFPAPAERAVEPVRKGVLYILGRPELATAALIYAAVMPATALAFVSVGRRMIERTRAADTLK